MKKIKIIEMLFVRKKMLKCCKFPFILGIERARDTSKRHPDKSIEEFEKQSRNGQPKFMKLNRYIQSLPQNRYDLWFEKS